MSFKTYLLLLHFEVMKATVGRVAKDRPRRCLGVLEGEALALWHSRNLRHIRLDLNSEP